MHVEFDFAGWIEHFLKCIFVKFLEAIVEGSAFFRVVFELVEVRVRVFVDVGVTEEVQ